MPQFFHGWRRKIGVITLLIACVFAAAWLRSVTVKDEVVWITDHSEKYIASIDGQLSWSESKSTSKAPMTNRLEWKTWKGFPNRQSHYWLGSNVQCRWHLGDFDCGFLGTFPQNYVFVLVIPYPWIVLPLTLLSTYLLLSKSRVAIRKSSPSPVSPLCSKTPQQPTKTRHHKSISLKCSKPSDLCDQANCFAR